MRKLLILFFATSLFVACNNNKKDDRRSDRDRDRERDDYRSKDDERDTKDADYRDDRDSRDKDDNADRDSRDSDRDKDYSSGGWPKSSREEFVSSCVTEAVNAGQTRSISQRYCDCMLEKMEGLYPDVNEVAKLTESDIERVINRYKDKCLE